MFSLVVPAYKEGEHIRSNLGEISKVLSSFDADYEIIPVDDGSPDNTLSEIEKAASDDPRIHPVSYEKNRGKGGAIKAGVEASKGDTVGFIDADLDISPDHLPVYLAEMRNGGWDVVIGSKMHKESKLEYPLARRIFSRGYYILLKVLFGTGLKDTQTGIKIYRGDLIREIAPKLKVKGYAFDIEVLALALSKKAKIKEMPVTVEFKRRGNLGRIRIGDIFKMFGDTMKIWWDLRVRKRYGT